MAKRRRAPASTEEPASKGLGARPELFIITGVSGSGKGTVLKTLEDLGYYAVDNLPMALLETFAGLVTRSASIRRAAIVVDIREGDLISKFPEIYSRLRGTLRTSLLFLDADDDALLRRFSETRRPHPLGQGSVLKNVRAERKQLEAIRDMADQVIVTSELTSPQLRKMIGEAFSATSDASLRIAVMSFGFRHGVPAESDLVLDVRFLPNPNYVPESPGGALHPGICSDQRVPAACSGHARFPSAALCGGGQVVPDYLVWLHRRAAQIGDDGAGDCAVSPTRGLPRPHFSPRHRQITAVKVKPAGLAPIRDSDRPEHRPAYGRLLPPPDGSGNRSPVRLVELPSGGLFAPFPSRSASI
jgi:hypothetical protein